MSFSLLNILNLVFGENRRRKLLSNFRIHSLHQRKFSQLPIFHGNENNIWEFCGIFTKLRLNLKSQGDVYISLEFPVCTFCQSNSNAGGIYMPHLIYFFKFFGVLHGLKNLHTFSHTAHQHCSLFANPA